MAKGQRKPKSGKKKWNQKKKIQGEGATYENKGLPRKYIQEYGIPVERALISSTAWDMFYKSNAGKDRARRILQQIRDDAAEKDVLLASQYNGFTKPHTEVQLNNVAENNSRAKAYARQRKA